MNITQYKALTTETVINPIIEYHDEWEIEEFTKEDIAQCEVLIHSYLDTLGALSTPTDEAIMAEVEKLVLALNELSEKTDYAMIETSEREAICAVIQESAVDCGLQDVPEDVTEQWREW